MANNYQATYAQQQAEIQKEKMMLTQQKEMERVFSVADTYINKDYLDIYHNADLQKEDTRWLNDPSRLSFIEMDKIVYDANENVLDKLSGVYNAMYNLGITLAIYVVGARDGVRFYFATRSDTLQMRAGSILEATLRGNFPGVKINKISQSESIDFLNNLGRDQYNELKIKGLTSVSLIPSLRDAENGKEQFVQGMEKFIDTMQGQEYVAVLLAAPLDKNAIVVRKHGLEELYSILSPHAKLSIAYGENDSLAVGKGVTYSTAKSINESVSNSNSQSSSQTNGTSTSTSSGSSFGGGSSSEGSSSNWGFNSSTSSSASSSYTSGTSFSTSVSHSVGETESTGTNTNETETKGTSLTHTLNFENKGVSELLAKIDEQITRIRTWESFGLWECCSYFFSQNIETSVLAATTYKALMTGETSGIENAHVNIWQANTIEQRNNIKNIFDSVTRLIHPKALIQAQHGVDQQIVSPTVLVGGNELPILLGLPRKSVNGVSVIEMAEFGRNVIYEQRVPKKTISIGNIYHMGQEEPASVNMNLDLFSSHCFITGSSGSGKSYATYNLLDALIKQGIKMLVIEPAKGEYKQVFGRLDRVQIYTTDKNTYKQIRINPFQFPDEIHVLAHIEQLLQIFNAAWPLYAAMPQILKESVISAYVSCGWDTKNSIWIPNSKNRKYPVFKDVLEVMPDIINSSDYSADSKGDYKGALLTRVQSMTTGIVGELFKKSEGIADSVLFDNNTIIDLSEAGSDETIAVMMGILIMKLNEYRKASRKRAGGTAHDSAFRHVTVLEEAHNLLKRTGKDQSQEGANLVGKSVEMISNSIKEMRTYGEGFIIIDQSPLAVDSSAVENTSTKIIMNTPSKDACEEVGSALSLNEQQTKELAKLNVGVAAVMQKGWMEPVLMKVHGAWKMSDYEAPLQVAVPGVMKYIRGRLLEELLKQVRVGKFSVSPISSIIRNITSFSDRAKENAASEMEIWSSEKWLLDRKAELEDIVEQYKAYKNITSRFTPAMVGELLFEITQCENLFDLISMETIPSVDEAVEHAQKLKQADAEAYFGQMTMECDAWMERMCRALEMYVQVAEEGDLREAVLYMLKAREKEQHYTERRYQTLLQVLE